MIGKYLEDRFKIEEMIGEGGVSIVYRGYEVYSGSDVALKVLKRDLPDPSSRERFLREAQSQGAINSPNVAKLYHFGRDLHHGVLYIAMEYICGDHLGRLLDLGKLDIGLALNIATQICGGLSAAHHQGIIHRDLKPANVMLRPCTKELTVKVLDFGFARPINQDSALTMQGQIAGTLTYIAPEQVRQERLTTRVDTYTLGVVLYEMITGRPPFEGRTPQATAIMHVQAPVPTLSDRRDVPDSLNRLLAAMLSKSPAERPDSIDDVRSRLVQILKTLDTPPFWPSHVGPANDVFHDWGLTAAV